MAQALEAGGDAEKAKGFRQREAAANAQWTVVPVEAAPSVEKEFARLSATDAAHSEWWALCGPLQAQAEHEPDLKARQHYYESWLEKLALAAATRPPGDFIHTVEAFIHNRLADQFLEEDPTLSASHASKGLDLRQAINEAHPGDTLLERNVLSSATHLIRATVRGNASASAIAAFMRFAAAANQMSVDALTEQAQALRSAQETAALLETATNRWPEARAEFVKIGAEIAAALLDRLPVDEKSSTAAELRVRLSGTAGGR